MNLKPTTTPHVAAYAVGILTTVAAANAPVVTAVLGPKFGGYAAAGIGLAGAVLAFLHQIGVLGGPAPPSAS